MANAPHHKGEEGNPGALLDSKLKEALVEGLAILEYVALAVLKGQDMLDVDTDLFDGTARNDQRG